jgi:hypothetical protein
MFKRVRALFGRVWARAAIYSNSLWERLVKVRPLVVSYMAGHLVRQPLALVLLNKFMGKLFLPFSAQPRLERTMLKTRRSVCMPV